MSNPGRRIGWGVIGTGAIVRGHMLEALACDEGSEVIGVVSRDPTRARALAKERGVLWWSDLESMLADPSVDAVYVASTHDYHAEQATLAAQAGKHVLCEKPLAMTLDAARAAVDAAAAAGVVLGINHPLRGLPSLRTMRQAVAAGEVGRPLTARFNYAIRPSFAPTDWHRRGSAAGVLLDVGIHTVDCARFLLASDVRCVLAGGLTDDGWSAPHSVMLVLEMSCGTLVSTSDSFLAEGARNGIEIQGTDGAIIGDGVIGGLSLAATWELRRGQRVELRGTSERQPANLFAPTIEAFREAILGAGEPLAPGADHLYTLDVVLRAGRALQR